MTEKTETNKQDICRKEGLFSIIDIGYPHFSALTCGSFIEKTPISCKENSRPYGSFACGRGKRQMSEKMSNSGRGDALPEPVANALMTTASHLRRRESWVPPVRGAVMLGMPRLIGIAVASVSELDSDSAAAQSVRQGTLRILAYLSADIRVMVLIRIATQDPLALDDILTGKIDMDHRAYRYNIMTSLGVFARHGLVNEVMTAERIERVSNSLDRVREKLSGKTT